MAESEQRFTLHARSRNIARIIGYPAGLGLLAAAVFGPFGDTQDRWVVGTICALLGLITLLFTWSVKLDFLFAGHEVPPSGMRRLAGPTSLMLSTRMGGSWQPISRMRTSTAVT